MTTATPRTPRIIQGSTFSESFRVTKGGTDADLSGATIHAALVDVLGAEAIAWTAQSDSAAGADWPEALLQIVFPEAATAAAAAGPKHAIHILIEDCAALSNLPMKIIIPLVDVVGSLENPL